MGDSSNIIYTYERARDNLLSSDFIMASVCAYWCIKYCELGEPYGFSALMLNNYLAKAHLIYSISQLRLKQVSLSKTLFIAGCQCQKALWLYRNKHDEYSVSEETKKRFERGHRIGEMAQHLFPNGEDATPERFLSSKIIDCCRVNLPFHLKQNLWTANTNSLMKKPCAIYEAAFVHKGVFSAVDILTKEDGKWIAYEVKSSPKITDTFILDCALQYHVIKNNI